MTISRFSNWKDYYLKFNQFDYLNDRLSQLRELFEPSSNFLKSIDEISKKHGICLLFLDSSKTKLQLFHHSTTIGGSWDNPNKKFITFVDFDFNANPVLVVSKLIKEVKMKSHSYHEFALCCDSTDDFNQLRNPKEYFHFKNIVPLPTILVKTFLELPSTEPDQVAIAFYKTIFNLGKYRKSRRCCSFS